MIRKVALFGGTFDPVHLGHLYSADELRRSLAFDEFYLVPCHLPPHRLASEANHRREMLNLALKEFDGLLLDDSELNKHTTSYTIETLKYWRAALGESVSLVWVIGTDAFANLNTWKDWQQLSDFANLLVIERAEHGHVQFKPQIRDWLASREQDISALDEVPSGAICFKQLTPWPVSATQIRELIKEEIEQTETQKTTVKNLLPETVWQYIKQHQLYR